MEVSVLTNELHVRNHTCQYCSMGTHKSQHVPVDIHLLTLHLFFHQGRSSVALRHILEMAGSQPRYISLTCHPLIWTMNLCVLSLSIPLHCLPLESTAPQHQPLAPHFSFILEAPCFYLPIPGHPTTQWHPLIMSLLDLAGHDQTKQDTRWRTAEAWRGKVAKAGSHEGRLKCSPFSKSFKQPASLRMLKHYHSSFRKLHKW